MPNWCANTLTIEHEDASMVDRFERAYNTGNLCNEFIPKSDNLGDGWYEWCVTNWGTKWDVGADLGTDRAEWHGLKATRVGNQVSCKFDSAWSPPIPLYETLDELGFMVDATYFEPGMAFCGLWHDGDDHYVEYKKKEEIPHSIWEEYDCANFFSDDEVEA